MFPPRYSNGIAADAMPHRSHGLLFSRGGQLVSGCDSFQQQRRLGNPCRMESLEERRLLSAVYPVQVFPFTPAQDASRASVNGEAFIAAAGQLYRSDGSAGTATFGTGVSDFFNWNGTVYFSQRKSVGNGLFRLDPDSDAPVEILDDHNLQL